MYMDGEKQRQWQRWKRPQSQGAEDTKLEKGNRGGCEITSFENTTRT